MDTLRHPSELSKTYPGTPNADSDSSQSIDDYCVLNYHLTTRRHKFITWIKKLKPFALQYSLVMGCFGILCIFTFLIVKYGGNPKVAGEKEVNSTDYYNKFKRIHL